jgi:glycosyltransferase involved in cell wall biosynthesis
MPSAYRTLTGLQANGFDVHVVLPTDGASRDYQEDGLVLHTFGTPRFGLKGSFGPHRSPFLLEAPSGYSGSIRWKAFVAGMCGNALRRGLQVANEISPAIVYGIMPPGAIAASAIGRRRRIPNVTRLFGTFLAPMATWQLLGNLWEVAAFKVPADLVIVTDDGTFGDVVARRLRLPHKRFEFLMNGVDEAFLRPLASGPVPKESFGLPARMPLALCAHHLWPSHHCDALVDAVGNLRTQGVNLAAVLAGDGPERERLRAQAAARNVADRVVLVGDIPRARLRELMEVADVVVSLDELSNLVNSVIEALAVGRPIVASRSGGTERLLLDGENAVLITPTSVDELTTALRLVVEDKSFAERLRARARKTAAERILSWDERMNREARLLRSLVGRRAAA